MAVVKPLLVKELREELRSSKLNLILILLLALYQQFFSLQNYASTFKDHTELLLSTATYSILYLAPIIIPFYGNTVMARSLQRERMNKSLLILMTTGLKPSLIWQIKTLAAFIISYVIYMICTVCDIVMIVYIMGLPFELNAANVLGALILSPLFAGSMLIVLSFIYWFFRNTLFITTAFTMLMTFGIWGISMQTPLTSFNPFILGGLSIVLPFLLLWLCSQLIKRQAKWKIGAI
ncbi:hypothetical protein EHV15_15045 [Paenibacillus oralis]|uniref:ABC transporter permease n=1 Tax=Paenibacillus oralis TaxID=2490856 RepID=A0A3P3U368_9BACL|nr:hypothetical protein [Paenibacillus oralis]RRJ64099.1 hypothetical protein EHV15_15045 [Paenibacillus oralis]